MTGQNDRARRARLRSHYAAEEAEHAAIEATETLEEQAVLSVRVPTSLAQALKHRAEAEHTSQSALVRRLLTHAVHQGTDPVVTVEQVEDIARRVVAEEYLSAG